MHNRNTFNTKSYVILIKTISQNYNLRIVQHLEFIKNISSNRIFPKWLIKQTSKQNNKLQFKLMVKLNLLDCEVFKQPNVSVKLKPTIECSSRHHQKNSLEIKVAETINEFFLGVWPGF